MPYIDPVWLQGTSWGDYYARRQGLVDNLRTAPEPPPTIGDYYARRQGLVDNLRTAPEPPPTIGDYYARRNDRIRQAMGAGRAELDRQSNILQGATIPYDFAPNPPEDPWVRHVRRRRHLGY